MFPEYHSNPILSLSELADQISMALRSRLQDLVWVKAEIHKLNFYSQSGHCYPDLVEKGNNKILAQMRATIWAGDFTRINAKFKSVAGRPLSDSIIVLFLAKVQFHPLYGLSINIVDIDPAYTLGVLEHEKQKTIGRLKAEGLFTRNKEKTLNVLPGRLAIISVDTSKGYLDFTGIIASRGKRFAINYDLYPALLQGDKAVKSIIEALGQILNRIDQYDAVAIIRGGGGDIGLDCYNQYELAAAVTSFPVPVLSGIGHSTNETVVELVSHTNLITPTDLAYFILEQYETFEIDLNNYEEMLKTGCQNLVDKGVEHLGILSRALISLAKRSLDKEAEHLDRRIAVLMKETPRWIELHRARLGQIARLLQYLPQNVIQVGHSKLEKYSFALANQSRHGIHIQEQRCDHLERSIRNLDPSNILSRGFSITRYKGKALMSSEGLEPGTLLETELQRGSMVSMVKETKNEQEAR